jgi:hypothetical protein
MTRQFWSFLVVGLIAVGAAVALLWTGTKGNHLVLDGKFQNVRTLDLGDGTALVVADFRVNNPSDVPLVIREVSMTMEQYGQDSLKGLEVSKSDVDFLFQEHSSLGGKANDVLAPPDTIAPGKTIYRMAEASFKAPASAIASRKNLVVHIEDVDGAGFDIAEKQDAPEKK